MLTDRELDARLTAAARVRDADLPALPEDFLAVLRADADRPDGGDRGEPASLVAARQLVSDAHKARLVTGRRRRPGRRTVLRAGLAVVAVAAAWTTAVLVAAPDPAGTPDATPTPTPKSPGAPARPSGPVVVDGLTLVAAERVTFPVSVDPAPEGLTATFGRSGGPTPFGVEPTVWSADYRVADGSGFGFSLNPADPRTEWEVEHELPQWSWDGADIAGTSTVTVGGAPADLVRGTWKSPRCTTAPATPEQTEEPGEVCTSAFADLFWERPDGQWVWLRGDDTYSDPDVLVTVAESLVDRPQPLDLQLGLVPAEWPLSGFEPGSIRFTHPDDGRQRVAVSLLERWRGVTVENAFEGMYEGEPIRTTVGGRPATLVLGDAGGFEEWFLAGELDGGVIFMIQTPSTFTQQQVVALAEQVTYTP